MEKIKGVIQENIKFCLLLVVCISVLFWPFVTSGKIPLPGDILLGVYHPWKDNVWEGKVAGIPVKNFELSDAITQFYPFKKEIITQIQSGQAPLWNPYIFSGTPLLADGHSGTLYPLNLLLFWPNFNFGWSLFILSQPLLASILMFILLKSWKLSTLSSSLGALTFGFSSYLLDQMEFGTVFHTALWIPLSLLAINMLETKGRKAVLLLSFSLTMSFLAGFMQVFLYHIILVAVYFLFFTKGKKVKIWGASALLLFTGLSSAQFLPWLQFLPQTIRWSGVGLTAKPADYLMPIKLLLTQIAPDFFGSPVTGNWTGSQFHYYEYVFYLGCLFIPLLILALKTRSKQVYFFFLVALLALISTLDLSPLRSFYQLNFPILGSLIPVRILSLVTLCSSIILAFGLEELRQKTTKQALLYFALPLIFLIVLAVYSQLGLEGVKKTVAIRNLILPFILSLLALVLMVWVIWRKNSAFLWALIFLQAGSLLYQGVKFTPFISSQLIFPSTKTITYLKNHLAPGEEIINTHQENFPVNTNMVYRFLTPNGYHPIHSLSYHQLADNFQFGQDPFKSFERTVFLTNLSAKLLSEANVRYIVTLENLSHPYINLVYQEGETKIYRVNLSLNPQGLTEQKLKKKFLDQPRSWQWGLGISSVSLAFWLILLIRPKLTRLKFNPF